MMAHLQSDKKFSVYAIENGHGVEFHPDLGITGKAAVILRHIVLFGHALEGAMNDARQLLLAPSLTRREVDAAAFKCDLAIRKCVPSGWRPTAGWRAFESTVVDARGMPIGTFCGDAKAAASHANRLAEFPALLANARHVRKALGEARPALLPPGAGCAPAMRKLVERVIGEGVNHAS